MHERSRSTTDSPSRCLHWALAIALCSIAVRFSRAWADAPAASATVAHQLGYNLDYPGDWTEMPPFIDQMKNSRAAQGTCPGADPDCDSSAHLDLDASGWVKSLRYRDNAALSYTSIVHYINTSRARSDLGRRFIITWEGDGDIDVANGGDVQNYPAKHRIAFTLLAGDTYLRLTRIGSSYLRNIRVFRASHESLLEQGELFNPDMLAWLAPFRSLRFMDWMQSNSYGQCSGGPRHGQDCYAATDADANVLGRQLWPEEGSA